MGNNITVEEMQNMSEQDLLALEVEKARDLKPEVAAIYRQRLEKIHMREENKKSTIDP